jgi:uncharacterized protein (TIGR03437 family)
MKKSAAHRPADKIRFMRLILILALPALLGAQLIPAGQPVPRGPNPPVVFLNGYQTICTGTTFASTFGAADQLLQANSIVSLFFDNCTVPNKPSLETLGAAFGTFLAGLKYTDGTPVTQVDAVAHSMGGLILRAWLAGKQNVTPAAFAPPANPGIRRIVFIATPHFGTPVAALALGIDAQARAMAPGSRFLFDLNSWNQGTDDLRGIPAIAIAGNGGTGQESGVMGFDDGVVALTSSSLGFYRPGVTRILPDCHTTDILLQLAGFCATGTPRINNIANDPNNPVSRILISFLTGTTAWQSVGQAEETTALATTAGVALELRDASDNAIPVTGASGGVPGATIKLGVNPQSNLVYGEVLPAAKVNFQITPMSGQAQAATVDFTTFATTELPAIVKPGPMIFAKGVVPAAGPAPFPYDVAAGAYVSIYGANFASTMQTSTRPYPIQVGDVQVLVNGAAQGIVYVSPGQINFVYSNEAPGLTQLTVKNANGQNTLNVRVAPAVPSIFLVDSAGSAAAVNGLTGVVVGPNAPLHAGDFISIYLTGLGATTTRNGLDYTQIQPTVALGGQICAVSYAGRTPGFAGLDQINCTVPSGVTGSAVPVAVTSNGRVSNTAFVAIQ